MKERLSKLLSVKSIVTILLTILFCVLAFRGDISQEVNAVYLIIVGFYFGTQHEKNK